jgi:beta-lactam-binding protein with PASTA domain
LNRDGKPDLVTTSELVTNSDPAAVSVLLNATGLCAVPSVRGKALRAAKLAIAHADCRVGKIRAAYSKKVKWGRVISQRPEPGMVLRSGVKVNLVVSRGRRR